MIAPTHASPCRACGALIFMLAHIRTGKVAPINVGPNPAGNVALELTNQGWRYRVLTKDDQAPAPEERYMPHFAVCPGASDFRADDGRQLPDNVVPLFQPHRERG